MPRKSIESQAFQRTVLTVETAAVNNLMSFCEGQHFYIKDLRTSRSVPSIVLRILKSHSSELDHLEFLWFCTPAQKSAQSGENKAKALFSPTIENTITNFIL